MAFDGINDKSEAKEIELVLIRVPGVAHWMANTVNESAHNIDILQTCPIQMDQSSFCYCAIFQANVTQMVHQNAALHRL